MFLSGHCAFFVDVSVFFPCTPLHHFMRQAPLGLCSPRSPHSEKLLMVFPVLGDESTGQVLLDLETVSHDT